MTILKALGMGVLLLMLIGSALAVIYGNYYARLLFIEIAKQEKLLDDYEVEWAQMQLEQTTFLEHNRIEHTAKKHNLTLPLPQNTIFIKP